MQIPKMTPLKRISVIVTLVLSLIAAGYSTYAWAQSYHSQFAQKDQVTIQFAQTKRSILEISIRDYEDQLFVIDFLIAEDQATPLDQAKKQKIERRLADLRRQVAALRTN